MFFNKDKTVDKIEDLADKAQEYAAESQDKIEDIYQEGKNKLGEFTKKGRLKIKELTDCVSKQEVLDKTVEYTKKKPAVALGVAFAAGYLIARVLRR